MKNLMTFIKDIVLTKTSNNNLKENNYISYNNQQQEKTNNVKANATKFSENENLIDREIYNYIIKMREASYSNQTPVKENLMDQEIYHYLINLRENNHSKINSLANS
jgi:ABC-type ATPase with predicted acetyltransferase domain